MKSARSETSEPSMMSTEVIRIRGARTHNLKNVDLDIPRGQLVVITGPSGSGKSSLAFDTLFAEGQRQFLQSLSVYARQFISQLARPPVDEIEGLAPVICIDQRPASPNPRSTVGTSTEIYDYLRLLFARVGQVLCHVCGHSIQQQTAEQILAALLALPEGTKVVLLAPLVRGRKGQHADVLEQIRKAGQVRVRIDGTLYDLDAAPTLDGRQAHTIEAVVDRMIIREGARSRLAESLELGLRQGDGVVVASVQELGVGGQGSGGRGQGLGSGGTAGAWNDRLFSTLYACPNCQTSIAEIEPRTFSFTSPYGACPACEGLGYRFEFDPELVAPLVEMAGPRQGKEDVEQLLSSCLASLEQEYATTEDSARRQKLEKLRAPATCRDCQGNRLRPEALAVRCGGRNIAEVCGLSISEAHAFFAECLAPPSCQATSPVATAIIAEISKRLEFLERVGLDYVSLNRTSDTLSGGELQRVRLARGLGSGLAGICYILDEPSIGLHPRDNERLIAALRGLAANGRSVLVVEHDEAIIRCADWLIDMGPGAGSRGGEVVAVGTVAEVMENSGSLTGRYLAGSASIPVPQSRRTWKSPQCLVLEGVTTNNLKNVTADFPLGVMTGVSGVSGSGKSSLINETLAPAILRRLGGAAPKPGPHAGLLGVEQIDKLIQVDQSSLGQTSRASPATYSGAFDEIRKVFAATKLAKQLGFKASRFSFNTAGGRCEECQGHGTKRLEMSFLPDLFITCPTCQGKRFNQQTLAVQYKGLSIAEVLDLAIDDALQLFENVPAVFRILTAFHEVGLGYLKLGQPANTLSGGESQRVKLATELARAETGRTLYVLDEPTTGLHVDDVRQLLAVLQRLVERGNTIIVVEHHLDVLKCCDYLLDLGPGGGHAGGQIVAAGTPEEIAALADNATGQFLRSVLT